MAETKNVQVAPAAPMPEKVAAVKTCPVCKANLECHKNDQGWLAYVCTACKLSFLECVKCGWLICITAPRARAFKVTSNGNVLCEKCARMKKIVKQVQKNQKRRSTARGRRN